MSTSVPVHQAVILAAGEGSRFQPFQTRSYHKSGVSLCGEPLIVQTIRALTALHMTEIIVIRAAQDEKLETLITAALVTRPLEPSSLPNNSVPKLHFITQTSPLGMADAVLQARPLLQPHFLVVDPQQLNIPDHWQCYLDQAQTNTQIEQAEVVLFSQPTDQPQKYGMLGLADRKVTKVVEKPQDLAGLSSERVVGIYLVNLDFVNYLAQVPTTEYQWEAALTGYAATHTVAAVATPAAGLSLKYAWDIFPIAHYMFEQIAQRLGQTPEIHPTAQIHPSALVTGPVVIAAGARIYEYALIQGPCYIGPDVVVGSYCKVRAGSILEASVELQNQVEVKHSIIGKNTHIHSGFIGDSVVGEDVRIGAGFITANKRLDRRMVRVPVKGALVGTGLSALGVLIGDGAKIGIQVGTNPGVVIAAASVVAPGQIISNSNHNSTN